MHANDRERLIADMVQSRGFVSFQELDERLDASPATIRRDLDRLANRGLVKRVRGGARLLSSDIGGASGQGELRGVPFHENISRHAAEKEAIGRAAAAPCPPGEGGLFAGGAPPQPVCPPQAGRTQPGLTNSLHIVSALLPQPGTRILLPSGSVFREQNIILAAAGEESMPRFHAPRLFMGAAAIGPQGLMQADVVLVAAERRLIERADEIIILIDSSKFQGPSGHLVCDLSEVDIIVTDAGISDQDRKMVENAGIQVIIAK